MSKLQIPRRVLFHGNILPREWETLDAMAEFNGTKPCDMALRIVRQALTDGNPSKIYPDPPGDLHNKAKALNRWLNVPYPLAKTIAARAKREGCSMGKLISALLEPMLEGSIQFKHCPGNVKSSKRPLKSSYRVTETNYARLQRAADEYSMPVTSLVLNLLTQALQ